MRSMKTLCSVYPVGTPSWRYAIAGLLSQRRAGISFQRLKSVLVIVSLITVFAANDHATLGTSRAFEPGADSQQPSPQQEVPAYLRLKVEKYAADVKLSVQDGKAEVQTALTVSNPSTAVVNRVVFRIGEVAEVKAVSVAGQAVQYSKIKDDVARVVNIISFNLAEPLHPGASANITVSYGLRVEEATARATIMPDECLLLPESYWVPMIHTPFQVEYSVDTAPFTLNLTVPSALVGISSGSLVSEKLEGSEKTYVFEEKAFSQPVFIAREFELVGGKSSGVEFYLPRGFAHTSPETLERLRSEIVKILDFYTKLFRSSVQQTTRVAASNETPAYGAPGLLILDERVFARRFIDEDTTYLLASTLSRSWLSGRFLIGGTGHAVLYDGLPSYLALLYMENRFGRLGLERSVERFRQGYASVVTGTSAYDAPLLRQTLLNRQYYTSVYNKVPLVLRLIESRTGRERLVDAIRSAFSQAGRVVTFDDFRSALEAGGAEALKPIFDTWFGDVVLPDFAVGKPVQDQGAWSVQAANFGSGDVTVDVELITESGERLRQQVRVEAQGYAQAVFKANAQPVAVAVDPDRLYLQADYTNDTWPRKPPVDKLVSQGTMALSRSSLPEAEAKLREAVTAAPDNTVARAALARALALSGNTDEAEKQAQQVLKQELLPLTTYFWANMALGEVGMARKQPAQAVECFRQASFALAEGVSLLMAHDALIRAEQAANSQPTVDRSVREFISQLDSTISTGRPAAVREVVTPQNLKRFIGSISLLKGWKSEVLRAENLDQSRVSVDVKIIAATEKTERNSRAIYVLRRRGGGWILDDIPVFLER